MAWYEDTLRSAGLCPIQEAQDPSSACSEIVTLGLQPQPRSSNDVVRWVTSAGWGSPDASLFVLGTTPKWHSPAVQGPNYAPLDVDRRGHARDFTLSLFPEFLRSSASPLRPTTRWTWALMEAWNGRPADPARDAFVAEMILCPQLEDPSSSRFRSSYEQCLKRHFFRLAYGGQTLPTVVILGKHATRLLYEAANVVGPLPRAAQPVVTRPPDDKLSLPIISSLAPRAVMQSGVTRRDWLQLVLSARSELRRSAVSDRFNSKPEDTIMQKEAPSGDPRVHTMDPAPHFLPEEALNLKWRHGRRWATAQSFAIGGTVPEIIERAKHFNHVRCTELGTIERTGFDKEERFLRDEDGYYPKLLKAVGWKIRRSGEQWIVEPPTTV